VRGRRHLPGAPGPDPFPETLIEVDGSEGTLRLREGYALTVTGREALPQRDVARPSCPGRAAACRRAWSPRSATGSSACGVPPSPRPRARTTSKTSALCEAAYASAATGDTVTPSV
jgi:hypothetical protein